MTKAYLSPSQGSLFRDPSYGQRPPTEPALSQRRGAVTGEIGTFELEHDPHWGLFLFSGCQHFIDACDYLPRVLDRSLALLDLCQEALTFFLSFFD